MRVDCSSRKATVQEDAPEAIVRRRCANGCVGEALRAAGSLRSRSVMGGRQDNDAAAIDIIGLSIAIECTAIGCGGSPSAHAS